MAAEIGVSIRTLYRDIASLKTQGAAIEGSVGIGYFMKAGFMLPPLMFSSEELDALVLGMRWVADRGDRALANSALNTLAKIAAVLPPELRRELQESALLIGAGERIQRHSVAPDLLRTAIRQQSKLQIVYGDAVGSSSLRVVWPFALVYFDQSRVLMCWCELRNDFRNFRTDRIAEVELLDARYPKSRQELLKAWRRSKPMDGRTILPEIDSSSY